VKHSRHKGPGEPNGGISGGDRNAYCHLVITAEILHNIDTSTACAGWSKVKRLQHRLWLVDKRYAVRQMVEARHEVHRD
jgi:hypothetical protein